MPQTRNGAISIRISWRGKGRLCSAGSSRFYISVYAIMRLHDTLFGNSAYIQLHSVLLHCNSCFALLYVTWVQRHSISCALMCSSFDSDFLVVFTVVTTLVTHHLNSFRKAARALHCPAVIDICRAKLAKSLSAGVLLCGRPIMPPSQAFMGHWLLENNAVRTTSYNRPDIVCRGRRLTSDAQGVDIGVLVPTYLPASTSKAGRKLERKLKHVHETFVPSQAMQVHLT